jgi:hypothetical protein
MARRVVARVLAANAGESLAVVTAWAGKVGKERGHVRLDDGTEVRVRIGHVGGTRRVRSPAVGERVRVVIDRAGERRVFPIDEQARANTWHPPTTPKAPQPLPAMLARAVAGALARGASAIAVAERWGLPLASVQAAAR